MRRNCSTLLNGVLFSEMKTKQTSEEYAGCSFIVHSLDMNFLSVSTVSGNGFFSANCNECPGSSACSQVPTVQSHRNESEDRLRVPARYLAVVHIFTCSVCFGGRPIKLDANEQPPFFERYFVEDVFFIRTKSVSKLAGFAQWWWLNAAHFALCASISFFASFWQEKMRMS